MTNDSVVVLKASDILRTLKQYIKVVQKDRLHTINRYKHLRDTDPAEAEALRQEMADHLRGIDQQMTVALGMLDRVPKYKRKVELQISEWTDFESISNGSHCLLLLDIFVTKYAFVKFGIRKGQIFLTPLQYQ